MCEGNAIPTRHSQYNAFEHSVLFAIKSECQLCTEYTWKLERLSQKGAITMAIIVNTNMSALKTQKNLTNATNSLNKSLERMSTGLKINRAGDDAAGLYVATGLNTQIRGSKVALDNVATGTNVLQTMEGDLDVMLDNLNRLRDLAVQAANSIYSDDAMNALKQESLKRLDEIDRIALSSNFNGLALLSGDIEYEQNVYDADGNVTGTTTVKLLQDNSDRIMEDGLRLQIGANADAHANSLTLTSEEFFKDGINTTTLGVTTASDFYNVTDTTGNSAAGAMTVDGGIRGNVDAAYESSSAAAQYIKVLDAAINDISNKKATIGATMNRLESATTSLTTTVENNTAAKSTIMDADIAAESAEYTKAQILQQTSSALLVQANSLPQIAISLVQG